MNTPSKPYAFFAYPATPPQFQETIERAISRANAKSSSLAFRGWPKNDIAGRPLTAQILSSIDLALFLFADVTTLNFNVTYEIGYAIGINKRAYMVRNKTLQDDVHKISKVGIFDTLGYVDYENADSLADILRSVSDPTAIEITAELDHKAPVYLLETPYRDDVMNRIISRVKKARLQFRSFNPSEEIRMAAMETVKHVANSHGVVIPLLPDIARQAEIHNIRGAFIAGLAHGMENKRSFFDETTN